MNKAGFEIRSVFDGEESHQVQTLGQAMKIAESVEICTIRLIDMANNIGTTFQIVWDVDPDEIITNFSAPNEYHMKRIERILGGKPSA